MGEQCLVWCVQWCTQRLCAGANCVRVRGTCYRRSVYGWCLVGSAEGLVKGLGRMAWVKKVRGEGLGLDL